jgi:hypothetical protein
VRGQGRYNTASDIVKLPKVELQVEDWQTAMRAAVVAEPDGPTMFARTKKTGGRLVRRAVGEDF